ncbi:MAG: DUF1259 domain-containing protein [Fibrella sp.]|nr:DUF1259 domain-containing protein [Armatimonadota bacterium]
MRREAVAASDEHVQKNSVDAAPGKTPALTAREVAAIEKAIGKKGVVNESQSLYTVPLPRNDLKVSIKGEPVPIPFGFGGWVSFKRSVDGKSVMVMSDTVLLQDEVTPVMDAALASGLEIAAVHNHFFYEEPRIAYMHVHGMGTDAADLAARYAKAIGASKLLPANQPPSGPPPARTAKDIFDIPALDKMVGYAGVVNGPVYKYTVGRADLTIMDMGVEMTAAIGLNSWASFAGTSDAAHIAGDIAMLESEVNPVIRALRKNNLEVVAVHSHMLFEEPRIIFLHYYGRGTADKLAAGFRAALSELGKHGGGRSMRMKIGS